MDLITPKQGCSEQEAMQKSSLELTLRCCGAAVLAGEADGSSDPWPSSPGRESSGKQASSCSSSVHQLPPGNESRPGKPAAALSRAGIREVGAGSPGFDPDAAWDHWCEAGRGLRPPAVPGTQQAGEHIGVPVPQNQRHIRHEGCSS